MINKETKTPYRVVGRIGPKFTYTRLQSGCYPALTSDFKEHKKDNIPTTNHFEPMSCNFCEKSIDGLKEIDHPLNGEKVGAFGIKHRIQIYQCQMCQEYWGHHSRVGPITGTTSEHGKTVPLGWDFDKIKI